MLVGTQDQQNKISQRLDCIFREENNDYNNGVKGIDHNIIDIHKYH